MPTITLGESAKLAQNELIAGVIENTITVNPFFDVLPFDGIEGNSLAFNRENALGTVETLNPGGVIAAKAAASFSQETTSLTTIIGDAEVNGLIQATRSGDGNDQMAIQIASKAKNIGRKYQELLVTGNSGTDHQFDGLLQLLDSGQTVDAGTNGAALSFEQMDEAIDLVTDKDGEVDYFMMNARTLRSYMALLRALGGANINEVVQLPGGREVPGYRAIPMFRNDWMPIDQTQGTGTALTTVLCGTLDDGSRMHGIAGLTAAEAAGIQIVPVGESETRDESITRIKWYCGLANFSQKGLAGIKAVNN